MTRRAFLVPEVLQTTGADCAPASLKAVLDGYGVPSSYEGLRVACSTDVEGTSVATSEATAQRLGLEAQQLWVPFDHLVDGPESIAPCLLVTRLPAGSAHLIVVWRRHGPLFQIMDPSEGRRWVTARQLEAMTLDQEIFVPPDVWLGFARGDAFRATLVRRLEAIGARVGLVDDVLDEASPWALAALDASLRLVDAMAGKDALRPGDECASLLEATYLRTLVELDEGRPRTIPDGLFVALPGENPEEVKLRGAVLIQIAGVSEEPAETLVPTPAISPWRRLFEMVRAQGRGAMLAVAAAIALAVVLSPIEAMFVGSVMQIGSHLQPLGRALLGGALVAFLVLLTSLEWWSMSALRSVGRRLELHVRELMLERLPRLSDHFLRTRPMVDLAHRAHMLHSVRDIPAQAGRLIRLIGELTIVSVGLCVLDPSSAPLVLLAAATCVVVPRLAQPMLVEGDERVQVIERGLAQFYLDALLGRTSIDAHGAERAVRFEHEHRLLSWVAASRAWHRVAVVFESIEGLVSGAVCIALVVRFAVVHDGRGALLLYSWWAISLPLIGAQFAGLMRILPRYRNVMHSAFLALDAEPTPEPLAAAPADSGAVSISFEDVSVKATGKDVLSSLDVSIAAGEHVAVIGRSGAGKSSLLELLLGWKSATSGTISVDGKPLDAELLAQLRPRTAWVDPATTLWNASLLDNVTYGAEGAQLERVLEQSELLTLLERMPSGLQTSLGESGRLVSGGEGQRIRLARALTRKNAGLVLLDEPFRGLERDMRLALLNNARTFWKRATLLCVTHDVAHTTEFDRVVIIENGGIVEQGTPAELLARQGRYAELLAAEERTLSNIWGAPSWKRLSLQDGTLHEEPA